RLSVESSPTADESEADESPHIVLPSSTELFYFYRQSLEQCAKYSTGQALYDFLIVAKFTNTLVKSRPLKEIEAEQLLIDLQAIKVFLMKLPGVLQKTTYTRGLTKSAGRLEALLKVIVTPVDPPQGFILNYTLLINDASFNNKLSEGKPKAAQNGLLDTFLTITSTRTDLESRSFLSSLDMDPSTHPGAGLVSPGASRVSLPLVVGASNSSEGGICRVDWDGMWSSE
ncbi:hypothetical protein AX14_008524, partial [Amanita brunnescens Koide BX004]